MRGKRGHGKGNGRGGEGGREEEKGKMVVSILLITEKLSTMLQVSDPVS